MYRNSLNVCFRIIETLAYNPVVSRKKDGLTVPLERINKHYFLLLAILISCSFAPGAISDPTGYPKFILLLILSLYVLTSFNFWNHYIKSKNKVFVTQVSACSLILILCNWDSFNNVSSLIGEYGRYFGLLSCLSYFMIALFVYYRDEIDDRVIFKALLVSGVFALSYGLFQSLGFDPVNWENLFNFNSVFGSFGNPNFFASFVAIFTTGIVVNYKFMSVLLGRTLSIIFVSVVVPIAGFLLYRNESLQGFAVLLIGLISQLLLLLLRVVSFYKQFCILLTVSITSVFSYLGFLGIGPLSNYLATETGVFRREFLSVGIRSLSENLWFGVGFNSYEFYFRRLRSNEYASLAGSDSVADSSHNLFLDYALGGGIMVLGIVIWLLFNAASSEYQDFVTSAKDNESKLSLLPIWLGLFAQSMVSTPYVTHLFWLWVLSSLMLRKTRDRIFRLKLQCSLAKRYSSILRLLTLPSLIRTPSFSRSLWGFQLIGSLALFARVLVPSVAHEVGFQHAVTERNGEALVRSMDSEFISATQSRFVIQVVYQSGLHDLANKLSLLSTDRFPRDFELVRLRYELAQNSANSEEKARIAAIGRFLDPLWIPNR
jgi:hypothetical protein